jgi:signal transduction histidine kinase
MGSKGGRPAGRPTPPISGHVNRKSRPLVAESDVRFVNMSVTPVHGPQGRRALLVGRDVTALRQMDLMKASFLSMISHELRTPLQAINGYLDVILSGMSGPLTQEQHEFIRRARAGSEHLKALVDDVLLMSRRDAGQFHLNLEPTEIEQVIDEACEEVELVAADAGITLRCEKQAGLQVIPADAPRIQQVLRNLLTNAIKFTPSGGTVTLSATYGKGFVRVIVRDTGVGIPAEHLLHIFERFYQVQASGQRNRGQGLGLAIARIIVDGHQGKLDVQSEPGRGSAFTILLPRDPET